MNKIGKRFGLVMGVIVISFLLSAIAGFALVNAADHEHYWMTDWSEVCKSISTTQHQYVQHMYCEGCGAETTRVTKRNHILDKCNCCRECGVNLVKNITLQPNKEFFTNKTSWARINISQSGYIKVETKQLYTNTTSRGVVRYTSSDNWFSIYDSSKSKLLDRYSYSSGGRIPVVKGTYYVKLLNNGSIKYAFYKNPSSKQNYTKATAVVLTKNKPLSTSIYSSYKSSTWKRYYKINLTKKQFLHINTVSDQTIWNVCELYDSKMKRIPSETDYDKEGDVIGIVSSNQLAKGTYYLVVNKKWTPAAKRRSVGVYYTISWN